MFIVLIIIILLFLVTILLFSKLLPKGQIYVNFVVQNIKHEIEKKLS